MNAQTVNHSQKPYRPITGYAEYTEEQHVMLAKMIQMLSKVYEKHGFNGFNPRPVELWDNLKKDGCDQQIFRICRTDESMTELALPFDRTVSLALYVAKNFKKIIFPYKRYDINISHRGEHPQPGRFRGFYQADVDIVKNNPELGDDVECIGTIMDGLKNLNVTDTIMYINDINLPKAMVATLKPSEKDIGAILRCIDKLDKKSVEEVIDDITLIDSRFNRDEVALLVNKFRFRGDINDFKAEKDWGKPANDALENIKTLFSLLESYNMPKEKFSFSPGMVRGLAYYTGIVFETFLVKHPEMGSIASGGRYNNLVGDFNSQCSNLGGVGGSIGLTRLFDVLLRKNLICPEKKSSATFTIGTENPKDMQKAVELATKLRSHGLNVDMPNLSNRKKFLAYTGKKNIPFSIWIDNAGYALKSMKQSEQLDFDNSKDIIKFLLSRRT